MRWGRSGTDIIRSKIVVQRLVNLVLSQEEVQNVVGQPLPVLANLVVWCSCSREWRKALVFCDCCGEATVGTKCLVERWTTSLEAGMK